MKKNIVIAVVTVWAIIIGIGTVWMLDYSSRPGRIGNSPASLSTDYLNDNSSKLPKLLVFLHPQCPCSRATLTELNRLVERNSDSIDVNIFFYQPANESREWVETALWKTASEIPNAKISPISETELQKFGAITSGQTLLYDSDGNLVFSGGITSARGHEGANSGSNIIEGYLHGKPTTFSETPVFGCILTTSE